jgi:DUF4097 and DUF4098 domain-containing protein YvlB
MTLTLSADITLNANTVTISINNCTINSTSALQITCPINEELLQFTVISYTIQLMKGDMIVDTITSSVTVQAANIAIATINYDFKLYYF